MTSFLNSNGSSDDWVSIDELKQFTDSQFPFDLDLPYWMWKILLRDAVFFLLMYPGWNLQGCQYQLEVRHVYTGQTREEWVKSIRSGVAYDITDLLNPHLWLIERQSLRAQYHKLFIYDPHWHCHEGTNHNRLLVRTPPAYAELAIDRLVPPERRADWRTQVRIQAINPCVYSILEWWIVCNHRFRL
jgi:hypothetical protein